MGKSFAQLLTSKAVLMAVGLAAVGGGRGRMFCGGTGLWEGCGVVCGFDVGSEVVVSLQSGMVGSPLVGRTAAPGSDCCCWT